MFRRIKKKTSQKSKTAKSPNYVADMDKVFQYWVRLRDAMPGGFTRCISCGKIKPFDQIQAGHYYSRAHFNTRWSPLNVNGECAGCNCFSGDHLIGYRQNLIKKIGIKGVEYLEMAHSVIKKWSNFEIELMINHYGKLCLQLSAAKGIPISKGVLNIIKRYAKRK